MKTKITPALNAEILAKASNLCTESGIFTKKELDKNFNRVVRSYGYTVKQYEDHAKKYF